MNQEIVNQLRTHFPQFQPDLVELIAREAELKSLPAGSLLMKPGQYFKSAFLVTGGLIKIFREDGEGSEFFMYYLQPGNACALSMICAAKNETSEIEAIAITQVELIAIPLQLMDRMMRNYITWYHFVLETYRNRFEEMLQTIDSIAFKALDERLEFYLLRQKVALKTNTIELTHAQIANDLGSSREVISRLLKKLEQQGKIKLQRNAIELIRL
jgi:CRP/FNR family transcriptional regulator